MHTERISMDATWTRKESRKSCACFIRVRGIMGRQPCMAARMFSSPRISLTKCAVCVGNSGEEVEVVGLVARWWSSCKWLIVDSLLAVQVTQVPLTSNMLAASDSLPPYTRCRGCRNDLCLGKCQSVGQSAERMLSVKQRNADNRQAFLS